MQIKLNAAARRIQAAGGSGYAGVIAAPETGRLDLYWKGSVPDDIAALIERERSAVPIRVHAAEFSAGELIAEARRLGQDPAAVESAPLPDGSGIHLRLADGTTAAVSAAAGSAFAGSMDAGSTAATVSVDAVSVAAGSAAAGSTAATVSVDPVRWLRVRWLRFRRRPVRRPAGNVRPSAATTTCRPTTPGLGPTSAPPASRSPGRAALACSTRATAAQTILRYVTAAASRWETS